MTFRVLLVALTCFNLFNHILLVSISPQASSAQLRDPDAYMRLVRVETLLSGASWQDQTIPRSNAPFGESLHWSRPLDVLIITGAALLRPFFSWHEAVYWSGFWISPLLMSLSLALLLWTAHGHGSPREAFHLGILFLCQAAILGYHLGGRADHHSLLVTVFCAVLATARPVWDDDAPPHSGWIPGALIGFGCWVSIEALIFLLPLFLYSGVRWLLDPAPRHARCAAWIAAGTSAVSLVAILTETPGQLLHPTLPDRLNAAHLAGFAIAAGFWLALGRLASLHTLRARLCTSGFLGVLCLALWCFLFPIILDGPYARLDPRLRELWLSQVTEVQPLVISWRDAPARLCAWLFPMLAVLGALAWQPARRFLLAQLRHPIGHLWTAATLVFTALTFHQIRWVIYAEILWLFPYALLMNRSLEAWQARNCGLRARLVSLLLILAFCGAYVPCYLMANLMATPPPSAPAQEAGSPLLKEFCHAFNDLPRDGTPRIAAHLDYGTEILYRTRAEVIATPYHGNSQGMLFWYETMRLPPRDALVRLRERAVTHVLLSSLPSERGFVETPKIEGSLYENLRQSKSIQGMEAVPLPENLRNGYQLFRVTPPESAAPPPPLQPPLPSADSPPPAAIAPSAAAVPSTANPPPAP